jgi:hypothetical protein
MRVLAVASEPISADQLRAAVGTQTDDVEVMVVAPALHASALRFWLSDADGAIARAQDVERDSVAELRAQGIDAAGDTGEGDVAEAVRDTLTTFAADRVVVFAHPREDERYREGVVPRELSQELGIPVQRIEV